MRHISSTQAVAVWAFLVTATLTTSWLAEHQNIAGTWTVALVMSVAAIKALALILYFMEIKFAPLAWRIPFSLWACLSPLVITVFWFLS